MFQIKLLICCLRLHGNSCGAYECEMIYSSNVYWHDDGGARCEVVYFAYLGHRYICFLAPVAMASGLESWSHIEFWKSEKYVKFLLS